MAAVFAAAAAAATTTAARTLEDRKRREGLIHCRPVTNRRTMGTHSPPKLSTAHHRKPKLQKAQLTNSSYVSDGQVPRWEKMASWLSLLAKSSPVLA